MPDPTTTVAPARPAEDGEVPGRTPTKRRWMRGVGGVVGTLLVVLVSVWLAAPGLLVRLAPVTLEFGQDAPALPVDGFSGPEGAYVVGYEHDTYLDVDATVRNSGPTAVTVRAVRLDLQSAPLLVPAEATTPGVVGPGQEAAASLRLRFDNCEAYHEREAMVVRSVEVEATVLGRTVVEQVALDRPLMARSPMLWQCPDRTLDRDDDRRSEDDVIR